MSITSTTPHTYGVLPEGNLDGSSLEFNKRRKSLGHLSSLSDSTVITILEYLSVASLSTVVACSRHLYIFGHFDDLWRDLQLRRAKNVEWNGNWKDTATRHPHRPIPMNVHSDVLFRSWMCRSYDVASLSRLDNLPRLDSRDPLSHESFLVHEATRPCVVTHVPVPQFAFKEVEEAIEGRHTFRATSGAAALPAEFDFGSYARYCRSTVDEVPMYLFDRTFEEKVGMVARRVVESVKKSCPFWDEERNQDFDLFRHLGRERRPDFRWMIAGPKRSGSSFHIDPNATHAWNAPLAGRKYWIFYPPHATPPGIYPSPDGDHVAMPISIGEWILTFWDAHLSCRRKHGALEGIVEPGQVVFVPRGWWHCVINLDDESVAMTMNYVSRSNLGAVLNFLKDKVDQVSGCRDRATAIKPENLHREFLAVLKEKRPQLLDDVLKEGNKKRKNIFDKAKSGQQNKKAFTFSFF